MKKNKNHIFSGENNNELFNSKEEKINEKKTRKAKGIVQKNL